MNQTIHIPPELLFCGRGMNPQLSVIEQFLPATVPTVQLPLFLMPVAAGEPVSVDDYVEKRLDIQSFLIKNPISTFLVRVSGDSMIGAGIHSGDILIVDRSLEPRNGNIVIAIVDGQLTVKRLMRKGRKLLLMPENPNYPPIPFNTRSDITIWGVVTNAIHPMK